MIEELRWSPTTNCAGQKRLRVVVSDTFHSSLNISCNEHFLVSFSRSDTRAVCLSNSFANRLDRPGMRRLRLEVTALERSQSWNAIVQLIGRSPLRRPNSI